MSAARVERKLSAILAADVAGYGRLIGADEEGTLARIDSIRREIIEPAIAAHRGRLFKTMGDGFLAEFASAVDAVRCAAEIQSGMSGRNSAVPDDKRIEFRVGINVGDVVVQDGDVFGDGVNIAARLEGIARPGGICVSERVHEDVAGKVDLTFAPMGEQRLKNIARPVSAYSAVLANASASGPASVLAVPDKPSIAVLPFQNMSGDAEQDYFADGMVEEIITGLARIRWLMVIARNSTFAYKGTSPDVRKVGRDLAVRYVLEGSVRRSRDRVRITAQLIEAETGGQLWAQRFDGTFTDVFDLQDQITAGVVAAIEPTVRRAEIERAKRKRPGNLDAYDLYLRALEQAYTFTPAGRATALSLLESAIALEPGYAEAHGLAAWCLQQRFLWGGRATRDREEALRHAEAVAAARTDDATALALAAFAIGALGRNPEAAFAMLERALAQNPSSATAHNISAVLNMMTGRPDRCQRHAEQSLRLSPFDPVRYIPESAAAAARLAVGEKEASLAGVRRALEANPVFTPGLTLMALCLVNLDRVDEARATVRRLLEIAPDTRLATLSERYLFADAIGKDRMIADLRAAGMPE